MQVLNSPSELVSMIRRANLRAEEAFARWDEEAYEGACESASRYYAALVQTVGADRASQLIQEAIYEPA